MRPGTRVVFGRLNGFDDSVTGMDDVHSGGRLRRRGKRVDLCPKIQVQPPKRWTAKASGPDQGDEFEESLQPNGATC